MLDFKLGSFLPYRLAMLSRRISSLIEREYTDRYGISQNQWRIIVLTGQADGLNATQICEMILLDKMTVSRAIRGLVESGHILRQPHQHDGRQFVLVLSESGRDIYQSILPIALGYQEGLLETLSLAETKALDTALEKLLTKVTQIEGQASR